MASKFVQSLKTAQAVFERYKEEQPKWWKRMDGTPILNDVAVRMAQAFQLPDGYDYSDLFEAQETIDHLEAENAKLVAALKSVTIKHFETCNCVIEDDMHAACDCGVDAARAALKELGEL